MSSDFRWTSLNELLVLNLVACAIHLVDGALGLAIARPYDPSVPIVAPTFEYKGGEHYITPMPRTWFSLRVLAPSVAVEFITAAFHVVYMLWFTVPSFQALVRAHLLDTPSANPVRWLEYSITATIMSAFGAVAIGMTDAYLFVRNVSSGVALQVCGYAIEVAGGISPASTARRLFNLLWNIGLLINFTGIVVLLYQLFASKTHGVFWIYLQNTLPFAIWFNTFGVVSQLAFSRWRQFEDRYFAERWYLILSLSTKVAVFWLGYGSFREILEQDQNAAPLGVDWRAVRYCAIFLPALFVVAYALYDWRAWSGGAAPRTPLYHLPKRVVL